MTHKDLQDLVASALAELRQESADSPVPNIVSLQSLGSREVFDEASRLCDADDSLQRELGVRILRELGPQDSEGRRTYSDEAIPLLLEMLKNEIDPGMTRRILQALAFNSAREAISEFTTRANHPDPGVRETIAFQLPSLSTPATLGLVADTVKAMTQDLDPDVRYYALYALFEPEEGLGLDDQERHQLAKQFLRDPDRQIQTYARKILAT
ncbi:HEAT repeat domain-containing protein [Oryzihumus leptocrescens]|uniref:HEAT repeat protein n=1 Tax=Oryzihumus leptocrescens TaxID=297536 RepID=A0A542ZEQ7_9MICO|nr:hypothetical protein [Oryzihumus leptocrescens]TQL58791.1 hypothetical protein FB474_0130 [Oryzihumus leptocrescens]